MNDESIEGGCSLALAIMYELSQGKNSPWYGYLQSLPLCEDLPIFWSDADKAFFKGTEMEHAVENDLVSLPRPLFLLLFTNPIVLSKI